MNFLEERILHDGVVKPGNVLKVDCFLNHQIDVTLLDEIARERPDIKVAKINVDEEPELANQFRIMSIPTLMVIRDKKIMDQEMGAVPKHQILAML